jgi:hypothetical protein
MSIDLCPPHRARVTFSVVMFLTADLDRPQEDLLRVGQQSMLDLRNSFQETIP